MSTNERHATRQLRRVGLAALALLTALAHAETRTRASGVSRPNARVQAEAQGLVPGQTVARDLAGGAAHVYTLALEANQFLSLVVEQRGVDVVVTLLDPQGVKVEEVDSPNGNAGPEHLYALTKAAGAFRLEIRALEKDAAAGKYEVKFVELRSAMERDVKWIEAQRLFAAAEGWNVSQTKEAAQASLKQYEEALRLWREVGDRAAEARALESLGKLYHRKGEFRQSLSEHEHALALRRELGDRAGEAASLFNVGLARVSLGEPRPALEAIEQSLALRRAAGDRVGESSALSQLGAIHTSLGDMRLALEDYTEALAILKETNDPNGQMVTLGSLAFLYNKLGELERARDLNLQALQLARRLKDRRAERQVLGNLGTGYYRSGDYDKAVEYQEQALVISRSAGDRGGEGLVLGNLGAAYAKRGDFKRAFDYLDQSLQITRAAGDRTSSAYTLHSMASVARRLGDDAKAFDLYTESLALRRAVGDRHGEHQTLSQLARLEADRGRLDEARRYAEQSLDIVEALRSDISGDELRASFFATVQEYYESYIDLLMRQHALAPRAGHDAEALQASERRRARSLLDVLAEAGADIGGDVPPAMRERELEARRRVNARAVEMTKLAASRPGSAEAQAAERALDEAVTERQAVEAQASAASPRYAALAYSTPLGVEQIQKQLLDADTALVEYSLGPQRSHAFVVTDKTFDAYELPKANEIEEAARTVYDLLTARYPVTGETAAQYKRRVAEADLRYDAAVANLSRLVLAPLAARLDKRRLLVVADGALRYVPFSALPVPRTPTAGSAGPPQAGGGRANVADYRPLIFDHEIVSLPSASALAALRREAGRRAETLTASVAVFADPVFDADDSRVRRGAAMRKVAARNIPGSPAAAGADSRGQNEAPAGPRNTPAANSDVAVDGPLRRLAFSREEAGAIASLAGAARSRTFMDFEASRASATGDELSRFRYVHFATHSFVNNRRPELSGIVLSLVDKEGRAQDGFLRLQDIYRMRLPTELVVLSACRTAVGREVRGEGLMSLTRGFMYAGARRVAASLWKVDDAATAELMERFYRHLLTGPASGRPTPAAALRLAQLELMRMPNRRSPFYWAAFTLQGEWR